MFDALDRKRGFLLSGETVLIYSRMCNRISELLQAAKALALRQDLAVVLHHCRNAKHIFSEISSAHVAFCKMLFGFTQCSIRNMQKFRDLNRFDGEITIVSAIPKILLIFLT